MGPTFSLSLPDEKVVVGRFAVAGSNFDRLDDKVEEAGCGGTLDVPMRSISLTVLSPENDTAHVVVIVVVVLDSSDLVSPSLEEEEGRAAAIDVPPSSLLCREHIAS